MMWKFILAVLNVLCVYLSDVNCSLLSLVSGKALFSVLQNMPLDPTIGVGVYKTLPVIYDKYEKIHNVSGDGIISHGVQLTKETFYSKDLDERDVLFHLYNPDSHTSEVFSLQNIPKTKEKLFVVVHGWTENTDDADWLKDLSARLVESSENSQVVHVDWRFSANTYLYNLAILRIKRVGEFIAKRLVELVETNIILVEDIVLIGFDLGAHICGIAGQSFFERTKSKLPRIIGLDPSGRFFEGKDKKGRLDETDAKTVMVVHTDISMLGYKSDCGTMDFYPNGGSSQPGCRLSNLLCNHRRSYELFISAISSPKKFPTLQCQSYEDYKKGKCRDNNVYFGDITETTAGTYYFTTTGQTPFYKTVTTVLNPLNWFGV